MRQFQQSSVVSVRLQLSTYHKWLKILLLFFRASEVLLATFNRQNINIKVMYNLHLYIAVFTVTASARAVSLATIFTMPLVLPISLRSKNGSKWGQVSSFPLRMHHPGINSILCFARIDNVNALTTWLDCVWSMCWITTNYYMIVSFVVSIMWIPGYQMFLCNFLQWFQ